MGRLLFHVKICGVTSPSDARLAAAVGADAIGFNFVPGSPRQIDPEVAREAVAGLPADVLSVGVFAGMATADVLAIARQVGLGAIQLHGHIAAGPAGDPPERCRDLGKLPVIRCLRLDDPGRQPGSPADASTTGGRDRLHAARGWLQAAATAGRSPDMVIIDAGAPPGAAAGQLGGTGRLVNWEVLAAQTPLGLPLALAGGLTAANVAQAIRATAVAAVDTASGVESAPGRKDPTLLKAFVAAARRALTTTA